MQKQQLESFGDVQETGVKCMQYFSGDCELSH